MCRYVIFWVCVFSLNGTTWSCPDREVCASLYIRSERLCLFFSFLLLLRPALDGDSSLTLPWLDTLDELCELKWVGTWRASPPWEANVALQPPTTHCRNTHHSQSTHMMQSDFRLTELHVVQVVSRYSDSWLTGLLCVRVHLEWLVPAVGQHVPLQPALTGGWCVVHLAAFPQTHKHLCGIHTSTHSDYKFNTHKRTQTVVAVMRSLRWPEYKMIPFPWQLGQGKRLLKDMKAFRIIQLKKKQKKNQYRTDGHHFIISHIKNA